MEEREAGRKRGQGLVEMAVALPVLLMLLIGVVEIGFALRSYLVVVNATREAARFASRGQFDMEEAGERVIIAGGVISETTPFLRTGGVAPNTGIIITRIPIDEFGGFDEMSVTTYLSGFIPIEVGGVPEMTYILPEHSWISTTQVGEIHALYTTEVNETREAADFAPLGENILIVEVFYAYHPLWNIPFLPLPDPWLMYSRSVMREAW
jgi:hypothetical protein